MTCLSLSRGVQFSALLCASALFACTPKGEDDTGSATASITGSIQPDGEDEVGDVSIYKAFAMDSGSGFMAYLSNNPSATCDSVVDYLRSDGPTDPSGLLVGGACDITIRLDTWDEGKSASDDPLAAAGFSINCFLGEGGWELETRDNDDRDYYWQGREWAGYPQAYSYDFAPDGDGYTLDLEMTAYNGSFLYESFEPYPASGQVVGVMTAERCESLAQTPVFPQ
jgi:hypothetical protein